MSIATRTVNFTPLILDPDVVGPVVNTGYYLVTPTSSYLDGVGRVAPLPIQVLVDGAAVAVALPVTGTGWALQITGVFIGITGETYSTTEYVTIPSGSGTLEFEALPRVDPATLGPVVIPDMNDPSWWTELTAVTATVNTLSTTVTTGLAAQTAALAAQATAQTAALAAGLAGVVGGGGGTADSVYEIVANTTLSSTYDVLLVNALSNTVTVTLPSRVTKAAQLHKSVVIKVINATYPVTITAAGADEIDAAGQTSMVITDLRAVTLEASSARWRTWSSVTGAAKITVATSAPGSPTTGDVWCDTS